MTGARVLCADPPWKFGDSLPGSGRGAEKHYPCLTIEELERFPLPPLADDCALFLWRVAAMQEEALRVVRAWGFVLKTELVWEKKTPTGKDHFGMGRIVRASHEICLIATRGRPEVRDHSVRSRFAAPVGRHSEKPNTFYEIVEKLYAGPYAELFARRLRLGWEHFGNQIELSTDSPDRPEADADGVEDVVLETSSAR